MRYLFAIIFPPLAVAFCAGPLTVLLNLFLCLLLWLPGVVHGILVVNRFYADRRHGEVMFMHKQAIAAQSGKKLMHPKAKKALTYVIALASFFVLFPIALLVWGLINAQPNAPRATAATEQSKPPAETTQVTSVTPLTPVTLPDLVQKSYAEVTAAYGQPVSTDKATGWAAWSGFKARFVAGRCAEVREREP